MDLEILTTLFLGASYIGILLVSFTYYSKSIWVMNVEPPETLVIIESIVYKSNGFAIGSVEPNIFGILIIYP